MRHHNTTKKFGREVNSRRALMRSLAIALILNDHIETTEAKAKAIRPYVEKLVTKAQNNTIATRRLLNSKLGSGGDKAVLKLLNVLAPRYKEQNGGYTRVVKTRDRIGSDGAAMAIIEFVQN